LSKNPHKTTRRTFIAKAGMMASGLTLGLDHHGVVDRIRLKDPVRSFDSPDQGKSNQVIDGNDMDDLTGPEVPYDHYIIYPEPKFLNLSGDRISLASLQLVDLASAPNTGSLLKEKLREQYNFSFSNRTRHTRLVISLIDHSDIQDKLIVVLNTDTINAFFRLYDSRGSLLHEGILGGSGIIDMSPYPAGLYLLQVKIGTEYKITKIIRS